MRNHASRYACSATMSAYAGGAADCMDLIPSLSIEGKAAGSVSSRNHLGRGGGPVI